MHIYNRKRWISDRVNITMGIDGSLSMQIFVIGIDGSVINTHWCLLTYAIEPSMRGSLRWAVQKQLNRLRCRLGVRSCGLIMYEMGSHWRNLTNTIEPSAVPA